MKLIVLISFILVATNIFAWEKYPGTDKDILSTDPIESAKIAINKGDFRLIMVAQCFLGMPSYKGKGPPKVNPRVLGDNCDEMFGKKASKNAQALEEWASKYNTYVQQYNKSLKSQGHSPTLGPR